MTSEQSSSRQQRWSRFLRWFFNSSPTAEIDHGDGSRDDLRPGFLVRHGLLASGALALLVLLVLFYSTVSGAVERAARHRAGVVDTLRSGIAADARPANRTLVTLADRRP
jgi:hypothetical protein